ncbi:molybdate ABC transporter permease subunit [Gammaproteobacteria bacterium]|nr:molybdate ABC transporter permease subunit [Gammaproteobacteria bacterium]
MLSDADLTGLYLTLKLALASTVILLALGTPFAWWLARTRWRYKFFIEAMIALPLVLPPTVLGFYLLLLLGANGPLSAIGAAPLAFTFSGLVIGSVIYSMPFVIQPLHDAFLAIGKRPLEVAATLRASPWDRFLTIALPLARPGFITASVLGFAHTIGEFGVVLMIGGNIPGQTQVLSIAIYDHVESLDYASAHWLSGALIILSFIMLVLVYASNKRFRIFKV